MGNVELQGILRRLDRLETENRWWRRAAVLTVLCLAPMALAQCSKDRDTVRARAFIVEDADGKTRASFGFDEEGARLRLFDDRRIRRASLSLGENGEPGLVFFDAADRPQAIVEVTKAGPSLVLLDANGKAVFQKP
jgi:hypothetical protein